VKKSRIDIIKRIYDHDQEKGGPLQINFQDENEEYIAGLHDLQVDVEWLERNDYISQPMSIGMCYILALTEKGGAFVRNGFSDDDGAKSSFTFNMDHAHITGSQLGNNDIGSVTLNIGQSIGKLENAIRQKSPEDQKILEELLSILESIQKSSEPIKRGILSRFSDILKKHTDLIAPLGAALISLLS